MSSSNANLLQRPQIWQVDIFALWSVIYEKCCVWQAAITCHGAIKCKSEVLYNSLAFFLDWKLHSHLPLPLFKGKRQGSHSESTGLTSKHSAGMNTSIPKDKYRTGAMKLHMIYWSNYWCKLLGLMQTLFLHQITSNSYQYQANSLFLGHWVLQQSCTIKVVATPAVATLTQMT